MLFEKQKHLTAYADIWDKKNSTKLSSDWIFIKMHYI